MLPFVDSKQEINMNREHFEDIDTENLGFGGLGGAAIENLHKTTARPTKDGVKVKLDCSSCGAPNVMTIEWPEAIVISVGAIPPGWKYDSGYIRPEIGCAQCRRLLSPGVTPDEATRWVKAAVNARFVDPQQANALATRARKG